MSGVKAGDRLWYYTVGLGLKAGTVRHVYTIPDGRTFINFETGAERLRSKCYTAEQLLDLIEKELEDGQA